MLIRKIDTDESTFLRIPLAQGKFGDDAFTISLLADAKGFIIEFDKVTYFIDMQDLIADILKDLTEERKVNK